MSDTHQIPLSVAAEMTRAYRDSYPGSSLCSAYEQKAFDRLINQTGCVGIRCYFAMTTATSHPDETEKRLTLVMVGYDAAGNDLVDGQLAEMGFPCPNVCSSSNALNSD
jgi:hypothetical protein